MQTITGNIIHLHGSLRWHDLLHFSGDIKLTCMEIQWESATGSVLSPTCHPSPLQL